MREDRPFQVYRDEINGRRGEISCGERGSRKNSMFLWSSEAKKIRFWADKGYHDRNAETKEKIIVDIVEKGGLLRAVLLQQNPVLG